MAVLALVLLVPAIGSAEVIDRSPGGFTIRVVAEIGAPPDAVWTALVREVGGWWDSEHTYSGAAKNLRIEARG